MGFEAQFSRSDINRVIDRKLKAMYDTMIQTLHFVGDRFVTNVREKVHADPSYREAMKTRARASGLTIGAVPLSPLKIKPNRSGNITQATPRYKDRTGALTSSVGFLIQNNGKTIREHFPETGEGTAKGIAVARRAAAKYPTGLVLVVVAGMEYAAAVESKGYDVLTGSSFIAERELREALAAFRKR
ncbi:hypothetical protein [Rufibacter sp. XAAS-G3-1]|uniref:hypothetical protein n=1 Tax=Rufibacter sp. XAAS-G3-1 TaxID=2729134 RepID=UPI0015E765FB|nr:hypothetical protein [Rufibacter sp. XAAS-G3-1]